MCLTVAVPSAADVEKVFEPRSKPYRFTATLGTSEPGVSRKIFWVGGDFRPLRPRNAVLEILAVEFRIGPRTMLIIDGDTKLGEGRTGFKVPVALEAPWKDLEILYHVRFGNDRKTFVWRPADYALDLGEARDRGIPPKPADLRPIGSGLIVTPESPRVGETFTALVILQNAGELSNDTTVAVWTYGGNDITREIPPVAPGRVFHLRMNLRADTWPDNVLVTVGNAVYAAKVIPRQAPLLILSSFEIRGEFTDEPIDVLYSVRNFGSAPAGEPVLTLSAGGSETSIVLPEIGPDKNFSGRVSWAAKMSEKFDLEISISAEGAETRAIAPVSRKVRPAARWEILSMHFDGTRQAGERGQLVANVRNSGNLSGRLGAELKVITDTPVATTLRSKVVAPDETVEIRSEDFAYEPGIMRGVILLGGLAESIQTDVMPVIIPRDPDAAYLGAYQAPDVRRIQRNVRFEFAPVAAIEEVESPATIMIPITSWDKDRGPAVRATISGHELSDRWDIGSSETIAIYSLQREAFAETVTVTLNAIGSKAVFLTAPPVVRLPFSAAEHGVIADAVANESGVYLTIANAAKLIRSGVVTFQINDAMMRIAIGAGEETCVFVPLSSARPGYHAVLISTPLSPETRPTELERFVPPDPFPKFRTSSIAGAIVLITPEGNDAHGLRINGRSIAHLPEGETAVIRLPRERVAAIEFGSWRDTLTINPTASIARLKILDLGDDSTIARQNSLVRFKRSGPAPEARIHLALNNLLTSSTSVPALEREETFFGAIRFPRPLSTPAEILIFEDGENVSVDHIIADLSEDESPRRGDWDWTAPVIARPRTRPSSPYLHLGDLAMKALEEIVPLASVRAAGPIEPPITPQAARDIERDAVDTSALGRIRYRDGIRKIAAEWRAAWGHFAGARLPVTLRPEDVAKFQAALENIETLADRPAILDRREVEGALKTLAEAVEPILGLR